VSRYLLDTKILSDAIKPIPSEALRSWLSVQADKSIFVASLSVAEIWRGILIMPDGKRRRDLERWFDGPDGPPALFAGRILSFDEKSGMIWAKLLAEGTEVGRPRSPLDMIIAAVAEANDCIVVTGNEKHFAGLKFVNPMR
jgi:hypothetical protein